VNHNKYYENLTLRQRNILTKAKQAQIRRSKVCVVGLGGNGGPAAEAVVRMGVENIVIADPDRVEISNLNRQPYFLCDVGLKKVDCIEKKVGQINPFVKVEKFEKGLTKENVDVMLQEVNVILDAADDYRAKVILSRAAKKNNLPVVHTAGAGYRGSVTTFFPQITTYEEMFELPSLGRDIDSVSDNEFLEHRRKIARIIGKGMYSAEIINKMNNINQPWNTVITPCYVAGIISAMEVIKIIIGELDKVIAAPQILQIDTYNNIYQIFEFRKNGKITAYYKER